MKILIIGATGFIGNAIYSKLKQEGHEVIAGIRSPKNFSDTAVKIDFSTLEKDKILIQKLKGFDVIINTVGIIAENKHQTFEQMHTLAPITLFTMGKKANVSKIIHISALGTQNGTTPYHTSKNQADVYLRKLDIDYTILHPSVVYGDDGKSTALFQALASLPILPLIGDGSQQLQPIHIDDLTQTVNMALTSKKKNIELDVVGADRVSYKALLQGFRKWLGYHKTISISMPTFGTNLLGKIMDEPTINKDNIIMLNQGSVADIAPLSKFLSYTPVGIKQKLFSKDAYNSQKLYASLYLIRPLLRIILGFVWIWSGIVSAFLYPQVDALRLLHEIGVHPPLDIPLLYIASSLDILLGILTIVGYKLKFLLMFQMLVIIVYTILLTFLAPYHWLHPFGPILKNIPLVLTIFILKKLEEYR